MPALISWVNWVDRSSAVITGSAQSGALGPTRLADPQLRARWRTNVTPQLDVDFGASREVGVIALAQPDDAGGVNADGEARSILASTDTVRHRLDVTTAGAGAVLDTTAIAGGWRDGYGLHLYQPSAPLTARYWRCNLAAASLVSRPGSSFFIDLGRAWAGPSWTPTRGNLAYGFSETWADGSEVTRNARSGLEFVDLGPRQRVVSFGFPVLTEADAAQIRELQRIAGLNRQVLFVPFPGAGAEKAAPLIGRLTEVQPITLPSFARYAVTFQIRQSL
jgi:hypothetical protein